MSHREEGETDLTSTALGKEGMVTDTLIGY
jgi:hypothetical protein